MFDSQPTFDESRSPLPMPSGRWIARLLQFNKAGLFLNEMQIMGKILKLTHTGLSIYAFASINLIFHRFSLFLRRKS